MKWSQVLRSKPFKKAEVFTLSAAHLSHDTFSAMLPALLPLLIDKLGMSLSMSAMLDIVRRIPALFNPLLGLLAERTGIRYFVILTPAVTAISMGMVGLAPSWGAPCAVVCGGSVSGAFSCAFAGDGA
jgi:FSR family fosmidomycin resistance protein-like MFS transporter